MSPKKATVAPTPPPVDGPWTVVQVAAFTGVSYQTARNRMLQHLYGEPSYDPKTRVLTVDGMQVRSTTAKSVKRRPKNPS